LHSAGLKKPDYPTIVTQGGVPISFMNMTPN
jgi:hypothetical protein